MKTRKEIRALADAALKGQRLQQTLLLFLLIIIICVPIVALQFIFGMQPQGMMMVGYYGCVLVYSLFVAPLTMAYASAYLPLVRGEKNDILSTTLQSIKTRYTDFFKGALRYYARILAIFAVIGIITAGVVSAAPTVATSPALIVPAYLVLLAVLIWLSLRWGLYTFSCYEQPETDCCHRSWKLMDGYCWQLFVQGVIIFLPVFIAYFITVLCGAGAAAVYQTHPSTMALVCAITGALAVFAYIIGLLYGCVRYYAVQAITYDERVAEVEDTPEPAAE